MRLNAFRLCLVFLVAGCHPHSENLAITKWTSSKPQDQLRLPAQEAPACGEDTFLVENVRREVRRMERAQDDVNNRVTGTWQHLQLSQLPIPQALFLNKLGRQYGDLNRPGDINVSHCRDVPCVINAVYRSPDGIEGWVIYGWWLKMGNIISFKNKVHNQRDAAGTYNGATYPLTDWLFTRQELYGYWRMLRLLPTEYSNLSGLKEIQRLPKEATFENRGATICGLAYSVGFIVMQKACLSFGESRDTGQFYEKVLHELSHQVDFHRGRAARRSYFSHEDPWKSEGHWTREELMDTITNRYTTRWSSTLKDNNVVSSYALNNPQEHFAETLAYFRVYGQTTVERVPQTTYELVKSSVFEGVDYHRDGLNEQFMTIARDSTQNGVIQMVMTCLEGATAPEGTIPLAAEEFPYTLSDELRACLAHQQAALEVASVEAVRRQHVEGCFRMTRENRRTLFQASYRAWLKEESRDSVHRALESRDYFSRLLAFQEQLFREVLPMNLFVNCHNQTPVSVCYEQALESKVALMVGAGIDNFESIRVELKEIYLRRHSYESARAEAQRTYHDFVLSKRVMLASAVRNQWENCSAATGSSNEAPQIGLFSVGHHWMPPAQFNCLNRGIQSKVQEITTSLLSESHADHISERSLVAGIVLTEFLDELSEFFRLTREAEIAAIKAVMQEDGGIRVYLSADFSWLVEGNGSQQQNCENKGFSRINRGWRFHQESDLRERIRPVCSELMTSPDLLAWLRSHPRVHEQIVQNDYVRRIELESRLRARTCLSQHPSDGYFNRLAVRSRRGQCYENGWSNFEQAAWGESLRLARFPLAEGAAEKIQQRGGRRHREIKEDLMGGLLPNFGRR